MAKTGAGTPNPSLIERYLQLIGMGAFADIFKTLRLAKERSTLSDNMLQDARNNQTAETLLQVHELQEPSMTAPSTLNQTRQTLLNCGGQMITDVRFTSPEAWINALNTFSQNVDQATLVEALEHEQVLTLKKVSVERKQVKVATDAMLQHILNQTDMPQSYIINLQASANPSQRSSLAVVNNKDGVWLYTNPQNQAYFVPKQNGQVDHTKIQAFYQTLIKEMNVTANSLMQIKLRTTPTADAKRKPGVHVQSPTGKDKRASMLPQHNKAPSPVQTAVQTPTNTESKKPDKHSPKQ